MRILVLALAIGWSLLAAELRADGLTAALVAPPDKISPGARVEFSLVLLNSSEETVRSALPADLHAVLIGSKRTWTVPIEVETAPETAVPGGGFAHATCALVLPLDATGRLVLELAEPHASAMLDVAERKDLVAGVATGPAVTPLDAKGQLPAVSRYHRVFAENISTHHPIYFIFGPKKPAAKFQFSFKYRLWSNTVANGSLTPPLSGVYFGYTQRSVWDITSHSSPFYDTSYMPEVMYESLAPATEQPGFLGLRWFGYQASVQHESNGRDGPSSRSMNLLYVRPMFGWFLGDNWSLALAPKLFVYIDDLSDNPDLERYRGYGEYVAVLSRKNSWSLSFLGRIGSHYDRGSVQLDLTQPLRTTYGNFASFLIIQYFDGYGESLLDYNKRSRLVRAGFALVR